MKKKSPLTKRGNMNNDLFIKEPRPIKKQNNKKSLTKRKHYGKMGRSLKERILAMTKESTKPKAAKKAVKRHIQLLWLLMAFVVVSIAYSTYVIISGTDGWIPVAMVAPQAIFASLVVIYKFSR